RPWPMSPLGAATRGMSQELRVSNTRLSSAITCWGDAGTSTVPWLSSIEIVVDAAAPVPAAVTVSSLEQAVRARARGAAVRTAATRVRREVIDQAPEHEGVHRMRTG